MSELKWEMRLGPHKQTTHVEREREYYVIDDIDAAAQDCGLLLHTYYLLLPSTWYGRYGSW